MQLQIQLLPRALIVSILVASCHGPALASAAASCNLLTTARSGDTCASLAEAAGITVSQFLRANPNITSCANLPTGSQYCIDPSFAGPTSTTAKSIAATTSAGAAPTGALEITKDGHCGEGFTCQGSAFGSCCSPHGWCGQTTDHCGPGCQAGFGLCGDGAISPTSAGPSSSGTTSTTAAGGGGGGGGVTVTATVYVTQTVKTTQIFSTTATVGGTATTTQIVRATVPITVTVPVNGPGGSATVTQTVVATATATSVVLQTSTTIVTQHSLVFISSTVTTIRTITITDAKMCRTVNTVLPRATAAAEAPRIDLELMQGVIDGCQTFYHVKDEDSCEGIVAKHNGAFDLSDLHTWNRQLSDDCEGLRLGHWLCVGV
ncbi:hypothetical protein B0T25DRAFT_608211 [Lasiosphaeria hispida]|uniref:Carbohydrate-binding module family 18 protein n=1 Tax=Lasiosphaeria hispida TaxID=260671 RepID=A0AAJ0HJA8_9PEZI|nr:hypothetical protein B0T25DRAFT_608211 [Lasiosphaeria hispida]